MPCKNEVKQCQSVSNVHLYSTVYCLCVWVLYTFARCISMFLNFNDYLKASQGSCNYYHRVEQKRENIMWDDGEYRQMCFILLEANLRLDLRMKMLVLKINVPSEMIHQIFCWKEKRLRKIFQLK